VEDIFLRRNKSHGTGGSVASPQSCVVGKCFVADAAQTRTNILYIDDDAVSRPGCYLIGVPKIE